MKILILLASFFMSCLVFAESAEKQRFVDVKVDGYSVLIEESPEASFFLKPFGIKGHRNAETAKAFCLMEGFETAGFVKITSNCVSGKSGMVLWVDNSSGKPEGEVQEARGATYCRTLEEVTCFR